MQGILFVFMALHIKTSTLQELGLSVRVLLIIIYYKYSNNVEEYLARVMKTTCLARLAHLLPLEMVGGFSVHNGLYTYYYGAATV